MQKFKMQNFEFLIKEFLDALHRSFSIHKVIPVFRGNPKFRIPRLNTSRAGKCGITNCYKVFQLLIPRSLLQGSTFLDSRKKGFTLLEVLVAIAILGIAITVVIQLFSANLRAISASGDYVYAAIKAESKMRDILSDDDYKLFEKSFSETTNDGYIIDVSIINVLNERTDNLLVKLLEINLTVHWTRGIKERYLKLKTMKLVK